MWGLPSRGAERRGGRLAPWGGQSECIFTISSAYVTPFFSLQTPFSVGVFGGGGNTFLGAFLGFLFKELALPRALGVHLQQV